MPQLKPQTPIINWGHPITKGLAFHMPLVESGSATVRESIFKKTTGTLTNTPVWVNDVPGAGVKFTKASSQYINLSVNPSTQQSGTTMEALIKVSLPQTTGWILSNGGNGTGYAMGVGAISDGSGSKLIGIQHGIQWWDSATTLTNNVVCHVAMTFDTAGVLIFYLNGVADNRGGVSGNGSAIPAVGSIGCEISSPNARFLDGTVYYVRMWNRVLTHGEIRQLYVDPFRIYWQPTRRIKANVITSPVNLKDKFMFFFP